MTESRPEIPGAHFLKVIGRGGWADVYLYELDRPRMQVAIKVAVPELVAEGHHDRLLAEADVMAHLADHPHIVPVLGSGVTEDDRPYIVMPYYPGPHLDERAKATPLRVAEVLHIGVQIASALETAHRAGILHRDIKPGNILISRFDQPALTDFEMAISSSHDGDSFGISVPWAAPEVISGSSNGTIGSDIYSLGATLWTLLVGHSPFELPDGDNSPRGLVARILAAELPATNRSDLPAGLERLLRQMLSRSPAERPHSALAVAHHLQQLEQELRLATTQIVVDASVPPGLTAPRSGQRLTRPAMSARPAAAALTGTDAVPEATMERAGVAAIASSVNTIPPRPHRWAHTGRTALAAAIAVLLVVVAGFWFASHGRPSSPPSAEVRGGGGSSPPVAAARGGDEVVIRPVLRQATAQSAGATGMIEISPDTTHTWSNYLKAGGIAGQSIAAGQAVGIECRVSGFPVADGNSWWYRIRSAPWNGAYYASADAFYNNGAPSGSLKGTPFFDSAIPVCSSTAGGRRVVLSIANSKGHPNVTYGVTLLDFAPRSRVMITCVDSGGPFYQYTATTDSHGNLYSAACWSADGPEHWVTAGGIVSNKLTWSRGQPNPRQP